MPLPHSRPLATPRIPPRLMGLVMACCLSATGLPGHADPWGLEGMDPVATRDGDPQMGLPDLSTHWHGQIWHFATEENRLIFEGNPRAFAPGLDGLCVVALSEGRSEPGDPRFAVVIGQRIYLTRSDAAQQRLLKDPRHILMRAREVWLDMPH